MSNAILPNSIIFEYASYLDFDLVLWYNLFPEHSYNSTDDVYLQLNEELYSFYKCNQKHLNCKAVLSYGGVIILDEPGCLTPYTFSSIGSNFGIPGPCYSSSSNSFYHRKTKSYHPYYVERTKHYEY